MLAIPNDQVWQFDQTGELAAVLEVVSVGLVIIVCVLGVICQIEAVQTAEESSENFTHDTL